jgi:hypothetical protein
LPPDAVLQAVAAPWNDPDGSGNTYQLSVTGRPLPDDPHPAHNTVAASAATHARIRELPISSWAYYPRRFAG